MKGTPPKDASTTRSRRKSSFAFPHQPTSERGGFIRYMEESGATAVFIDVFSALYNERDKPDDPLEWIRLYLRGKSEARTELLEETVEQRRNEILEAAKELEQLKVQKVAHDQLMEDVQEKLSRFTKNHMRENIDEGFVEDGGDSRWQIQPDPIFVGTWAKDEVARQLANVKGLALEAEDDIEDGVIVVENPNAQVSDFAPSDDDEGPSRPKTPAGTLIPSIFVSRAVSGIVVSATGPPASPKGSVKFDTEPRVSAAIVEVPFSDNPELLPFYEMVEKSTETSPQPSNQILGLDGSGEGLEFDEEEMEMAGEANLVTKASWENLLVPPPSAVDGGPSGDGRKSLKVPSKTEVARKKIEQISEDFWTDDFTLGKIDDQAEESSEDDEYMSPAMILIRNKLQARRYRAESFQEHAWLADHYENQENLIRPGESEIIIEDVLGTLTLTTKVKEGDENKEGEISLKRDKHHSQHNLAKYEWIKKEHGVQQLRPIRKGGAIRDHLKHHSGRHHSHHHSHHYHKDSADYDHHDNIAD